jgi:hypothetical protein
MSDATTMDKMVQRVLRNASRAEVRHMRHGDLSVAVWLAERLLEVTPTQAERVSHAVLERLEVT